VTRRVIAVEETIAARLGNDVRAIFGNDASASQGVNVVLVLASCRETGEQVESMFAQNILALDARDAFHRAVPRRIPEFAIERDDAVDVGLEQALEKKILFFLFAGHEGL